jgi:hypothetical protein
MALMIFAAVGLGGGSPTRVRVNQIWELLDPMRFENVEIDRTMSSWMTRIPGLVAR